MECSICKKIFKTETRYNTHVESCSNNSKYECFICNKKISYNSVYKRHLESCKNNIAKIKDTIEKKQQSLKIQEEELKEREQAYNQELNEREQAYNQELKLLQDKILSIQIECNNKLLLKDKDHAIALEKAEVNYMKKLQEVTQKSGNKTINNTKYVQINNIHGNGGISTKDLGQEFKEIYAHKPFVVNDDNFSTIIGKSSVIKNNVTINDVSRGICTWFDRDKQQTIRDIKMKELTNKSIDAVDNELTNNMLDHNKTILDITESEFIKYETDKSDNFINSVLIDKVKNSLLVKKLEGKSFDTLKTLLPNTSEIQQLTKIISKIFNSNLLITIFASFQDIGFELGKKLVSHNLKFNDTFIIINKISYRNVDFLRCIYSIIYEIIKCHEQLIIELISSNAFKLEHFISSNIETKMLIEQKIMICEQQIHHCEIAKSHELINGLYTGFEMNKLIE